MSRRPSLTPQLWIGQQIWLFTLLFHCMGRVVWWDIFRISCWQLMSPHLRKWNTQRRTPVGFQVLFFEINWKGFFLLWRCCQNQLQMYDVDGNGVIDQQDGMTKIVQQVNVRIWGCTSKPTISQTRYPSPVTLVERLGFKLHKAREHSSSF